MPIPLLNFGVSQSMGRSLVALPIMSFGWFLLTCFVFFGFGLIVAVGVMYYAVKTGSNPLGPLKALGGGLIGSVGFASLSTAIGKAIEGLPIEITWAQAGIVTAAGFIVGTGVTLILGWLYVRNCVIRPVRRRFGPIQAAIGWVTLAGRFEPIGAWLARITRSLDMDDAWDEFTEAAIYFFRKLDSDSRGGGQSERSLFDAAGVRPRSSFDLFVRALEVGSPPGKQASKTPLDIRRAMDVLQPVLAPLVETLTSRLRRNSLNFTVWRVHQRRDELEHLISFPFESGDGAKKPLRIWKTDDRVRPATCAAEAMLTRRYLVLDENSARASGWDIRRLGAAYSQVGCMPIPADGTEPWGVLCAEIREGQLPMSSAVMKRILTELSDLIHRLSRVASSRAIDNTRTSSEHTSGENRKDK